MLHLLLAREDVLEGLRSGLRTGPNSTQVLWLFGGAVALLVILIVARKLFAKEPTPTHKVRKDHMIEAATVAGLLQSEISELRIIASRARIAHPAAILLSPANMAHAVREALGPHPDRATVERLQRLSHRLFEQPLPGIGAPPDEYV